MSSPKFSRRTALQIAGLGTLGATVDCVFPDKIMAWSSVWVGNTHALIDTNAYKRLQELPFFTENNFPPLKSILDNEGSDALLADGKGPDRTGSSLFRQHYFNPELIDPVSGEKGVGDGPSSCGKHGQSLYYGIVMSSSLEIKGLDAAWGAHFLADMSVPYHVVGCPIEILETFMVNGSVPSGTLEKIQEIMGDPGLYYVIIDNKLQCHDVRELARRFMAANADDNVTDWFDPWYWNGAPASHIDHYIYSSHVMWEGTADLSSGSYRPRIHTDWENPATIRFDKPWELFEAQAIEFATACAVKTRAQLLPRFKTKTSGFKVATDAVYTYWRALITAMKGEIVTAQTEDGFKISIIVTNLDQHGAVKNVQARLSIMKKGKIVQVLDDEIVDVASTLGFGQVKNIKDAWEIKKPGPVEEGPYHLKLELIGNYAVPDAQYKAVIQELDLEWPKIYKGKAAVLLGAKNAKGQASCPGQADVKLVLEKPENGTGKGSLLVIDSTGVLYSDDDVPECKPIPSNQVTLNGTHDGEKKYKFSIGRITLLGSFNDEYAETHYTMVYTDGKTGLSTNIDFEIPKVLEESDIQTNNMPINHNQKEFNLDVADEFVTGSRINSKKSEWETVFDYSDNKREQMTTKSIIELFKESQ